MTFGGMMPEKVGRYEIVLPIARGGMATVYLARAEGLGGFDRYVALKLTAEHLRDDPEFATHLLEEAKLVAHLRHTNVVPVLDVGEDELGAVFLVMEYVPGDTLGGLLRRWRKGGPAVPPRIGLRILVDALAGLHAAHEHADEDGHSHRLVHRDFSPQNILVGTDGIARLTDFGIAKAASRASVTIAGTMKGKVSYASPEQARGKELDRRCDVWAAGVIAWEIFAGKKLYPSSDRTLLEIVKAPPPRIRSVVPDVPADIDEAIAGALEMDVNARTPTAQAFGRALASAANAAGLLAEVDEVAEHIRAVAEPVLAERREKIAEARRLRSEAADDGGPTLVMRTAPLPSLPDIPMPVSTQPLPTSPLGPLRMGPAPVPGPVPAPTPADDGRGSFHSTTPAGIATAPGEPEVPRPRSHRRSMLTIPALPEGFVGEKSWSKAARFVADRPRVVIGAASALTTLLLVASIVVFASAGSSGAKGSTASTHASGSAVAAASTAAAVVPKTSSLPAAPPVLEPPEPLPPQIEVRANAPIARVRIGKRPIEIEAAAPTVAIDLFPEETTGRHALLCTSIDGRTASTIWEPSPNAAAVAVTFGDTPPPPPAPKPAGGRPKPPAHKPAPKTGPGSPKHL